MIEQYKDNQEALKAFRLIAYTNESVFLTGKAGTGKSTFLKNLVRHLPNKKCVILAPTGVAALNVGGQTIHSFFKLEPRPYLPNDKDINIILSKQAIIRNTDLIVIDEISMVRSDLFNAINVSLQKHCGNQLPFGGKQVLMIGDLFQLPPVVNSKKAEEVAIIKQNYQSEYFFGSNIPNFKYHIVEFNKIYRQSGDNQFIDVLNAVREDKVLGVHINTLNSCVGKPLKGDEIILCTKNDLADTTNSKELLNLPSKQYNFVAEVSGVFEGETAESKLPAPSMLTLKDGAQVMFLKNDSDKRWVNGTIGKIVKVKDGSIIVSVAGINHDVERYLWENCEYKWNKEEHKIEKEITGTFKQYPIKLAWAITIHKSQGKTFTNVQIDLGTGAFAAGQTYVALSRCTTLNGITLKHPISLSDIKVSDKVKQFTQVSRQASNSVSSDEIMESMDSVILDLAAKLAEVEDKAIEKNKKMEETTEQLQAEIKQLNQKINDIQRDSKINIEKIERENSSLTQNNSTKNAIIVALLIVVVILYVITK